MELTVQNVYGLLLRSKLLSIDEARGLYARWQEEAKDNAGNLAKFASWMVANKYVTEYQASLLARGHAEGFFLGQYKVLDRLGKGRMAGVYKAQHQLGQVVAIKVLPPSKAKDPTSLARFQREARMALKLRHPNIVRSFQMGTDGPLHFLVMEFLEGETLEEVLARRPKMPPAEAVRLAYQALQGLQHIHEQGLVHRDLKPANLMLVPPPQDANTARCTLRILDIGLGRALFEEGAEALEVTGEGVLLGTPDYMAPEQARDPRSADIRSDVYSVGCVLYHLLTGQPPFPDTNIISQMIRHATETPKPLRELNSAVPDGLQQILNWMMAKAPEGRYPTPERAAKALEMFLAAGGAPLSAPDLDPKMKPFLTWLEIEDRKSAPPGPTVPVVNLAAAKPPSATLPAAPAKPPAATLAAAPAARPPSGTMPVAPAKAAPPAALPVAIPARVEAPKGEKPAEEKPAADRAPKERARAEAPASEDRSAGKKRHKKGKRPLPPPLPVPPAAVAVSEEDVNVELVPFEGPMPATPKGGLGLTRRDFVMYGAGVGSVLVGLLIGFGLYKLVGLFR